MAYGHPSRNDAYNENKFSPINRFKPSRNMGRHSNIGRLACPLQTKQTPTTRQFKSGNYDKAMPFRTQHDIIYAHREPYSISCV